MKKILKIYLLLQAVPKIIVQFCDPEISETQISLDSEIQGNELSAYVDLMKIQEPTKTVFASKTTYEQNGKNVPCVLFESLLNPPTVSANFVQSMQIQNYEGNRADLTEDNALTPVIGCTKVNDTSLSVTSLPALASFLLPINGLWSLYSAGLDYDFAINDITAFAAGNGDDGYYPVYVLMLNDGEGNTENRLAPVISNNPVQLRSTIEENYFATNATEGGPTALLCQSDTDSGNIKAIPGHMIGLYFSPALSVDSVAEGLNAIDGVTGSETIIAGTESYFFELPPGSKKILVRPSAP